MLTCMIRVLPLPVADINATLLSFSGTNGSKHTLPKLSVSSCILKAFKLFLLDVGLLSCMAGLSKKILLDGSDIFTEFKGALTEQYVLQQLKCSNDIALYYYTNERNSCEIDFLIDNGEEVIPVEVKAEQNLSAKSLKTYREKYKPEHSIRISMADYQREDGLENIPLYAIEVL